MKTIRKMSPIAAKAHHEPDRRHDDEDRPYREEKLDSLAVLTLHRVRP